MEHSAILVAGGSGQRMQTDVPKQFLELAGMPVLVHTIRAFQQYDSEIELVVVLPNNELERWAGICKQYGLIDRVTAVAGGASRTASVRNGLVACKGMGLIGIHDGVRPFVSATLIGRCFAAAEQHGAAVPVVSIQESIREKLPDGRSRAEDRNRFVAIQTPQCFRAGILREAYEAFEGEATDDATVVEAAGHPISLVEGERNNLKLTTPLDLQLAALLIHSGIG